MVKLHLKKKKEKKKVNPTLIPVRAAVLKTLIVIIILCLLHYRDAANKLWNNIG